MSEAKGVQGKALWKAATDPKSGREYYYNTVTKETTWHKPDDLLTPEERDEVRKKKEETRKFFSEMENNILSKLRGEVHVAEEKDGDGRSRRDSDDGFLNGRPRRSSVGGIRLVRTISTIDDELLEMIKYRTSSSYDEEQSLYMPDPFGPNVGLRQRASSLARSMDEKDEKDGDEKKESHPPQERNKTQPKGCLRRRNSTGTIYIDSTLSKPDDTHTMECIGVVIRAHMIDAVKQKVVPRKEYETFDDLDYVADAKDSGGKDKIPEVEKITKFFSHVFEKCQIEHECIIITLIYIERLIKVTKGRLVIKPNNWRSILFACIIMASKVWDDLSMWNVDFSQVSGQFDLHRINELELALLSALEYSVKVPASEYAKYYFHLRSMMAQLGFHKESNTMLVPLDIKGARKLELSTEEYQNTQQLEQGTRRRGATVVAAGMPGRVSMSRMQSTPEGVHEHHDSVGLEQLVHGVHLNADGSVPSAKKKSRPAAIAESKR